MACDESRSLHNVHTNARLLLTIFYNIYPCKYCCIPNAELVVGLEMYKTFDPQHLTNPNDSHLTTPTITSAAVRPTARPMPCLADEVRFVFTSIILECQTTSRPYSIIQ